MSLNPCTTRERWVAVAMADGRCRTMLPLLDDGYRALVEARLAYIQKSSDVEEKVAAVPEALRSEPGLAYDRYNWLADRGERTQAVALLRERSTDAASLGEPFRWSGWRRSLARWEMREGRPEVAYELASKHFLTSGTSYADLEWIAGYVALTYLDQPDIALGHFRAARAAVTSPISMSRMDYWTARTLEEMGQPASPLTGPLHSIRPRFMDCWRRKSLAYHLTRH